MYLNKEIHVKYQSFYFITPHWNSVALYPPRISCAIRWSPCLHFHSQSLTCSLQTAYRYNLQRHQFGENSHFVGRILTQLAAIGDWGSKKICPTDQSVSVCKSLAVMKWDSNLPQGAEGSGGLTRWWRENWWSTASYWRQDSRNLW